MPALVINGNELVVRRDGLQMSYERSVDKVRTPTNVLKVAVLGPPKRVLEARSVPMPWSAAQGWASLDQTLVSVGGDYTGPMTAWCEVEVVPLPMGYGEVLVRLEEV